MGKRHNRKRTRSRPRHRDGINTNSQNHTRSESVDTTFSRQSTIPSSFSTTSHYPHANPPPDHWHNTYSSWQDRIQLQQEQEREVETQRLRIFGGLPGDEVSLLEPMLQVVLNLFDGFTDYEDP